VRALPAVPGKEAIDLWFERLDPRRERDDDVLVAAVEGIGARADDAEVVGRLTDLARDAREDRDRRALALEAMGALSGRAVGLVLTVPLEGGDWVTECARALALGRRGGRASVPPLLHLLGHEDLAVRTHACEALRRATRVRLPDDRAAWVAWWEGERDRPEASPFRPVASSDAPDERYVEAEPEPDPAPHYYGIPLPRPGRSHVVFCLDVSQSMWGAAITRARRELARTIRSMPTTCRFEVLAFHERVAAFSGRLAPAHPIVKARALAWAEALETVSYTNVYDALETAFGYAGRGSRASEDPVRLDAVFLLSDGAPNRGRFQVPAHVVREVSALSNREIPVHTVGAGDEAFPLLRALAEATGGRFANAFE
jgi:hypothetical protein